MRHVIFSLNEYVMLCYVATARQIRNDFYLAAGGPVAGDVDGLGGGGVAAAEARAAQAAAPAAAGVGVAAAADGAVRGQRATVAPRRSSCNTAPPPPAC